MNDFNLPCCCDCPNRWPVFDNLTKEQFQELCENRKLAQFEPKQIIFKQGTPCHDAVFLISGIGKLSYENPSDKKVLILNLVGQSTMIASPNFLVNGTYTYTLSSLSQVLACFIPKTLILKFLKTNAKFAEGLVTDISTKYENTFNKLVSLTHKKMPGRLAEVLLYLSNEVYKSDEFDLNLSRSELGQLANMAKENVVRILKDLNSEGIIYMDSCNSIRIIDKKRLVDFQ